MKISFIFLLIVACLCGLMGGFALAQDINKAGDLTATEFVETGFDPLTELKGSWYLDGDATDSSGLGNNGTLIGVPTATGDRFGVAGKALDFDGGSQYITLGASTSYRTFSAWFRTTKATTVTDQIIAAGFLGASYYALGIQSSKLCISSGGAGTGVATQNTYATGTWYHVVVVRTDSPYPNMFKIYVNGIEQTLAASAYQRVSNIRIIGARYYSSEYTLLFQGQIDDVRVWDRILSDDEVLSMYNVEKDAAKFNAANDGTFTAPWFVEGDAALPVQMRGKKESLTVKGSLIEQ